MLVLFRKITYPVNISVIRYTCDKIDLGLEAKKPLKLIFKFSFLHEDEVPSEE